MTYELRCGISTQFHVLEKDRKKTGASTIAILRRRLNVPQDICNISIFWLTFFSNNKQTLLSHTVVCIWTISCTGTSEIQNNELSIQSPAKERNGSLARPDMFCSEINKKTLSLPLHPQITNLSFPPLFFSPHYISDPPFYSVNGGTLNTKESTRVYNKQRQQQCILYFLCISWCFSKSIPLSQSSHFPEFNYQEIPKRNVFLTSNLLLCFPQGQLLLLLALISA